MVTKDKVYAVAKKMLQAVKDETPSDGVWILATALMKIVEQVGKASGKAPLELETEVLHQLQVNYLQRQSSDVNMRNS